MNCFKPKTVESFVDLLINIFTNCLNLVTNFGVAKEIQRNLRKLKIAKHKNERQTYCFFVVTEIERVLLHREKFTL